jgi:YD repeat-containing protein
MRLTSDGVWTSYTYDSAGRPLTRSNGTITEHFTYDSLNRLVRVDRTGGSPILVTLTYNDEGLISRIVADGVGRRLLWDTTQAVPQLLEERTDAGAPLRRYVQGVGQAAMIDSGGVKVLHTSTRQAILCGSPIHRAQSHWENSVQP